MVVSRSITTRSTCCGARPPSIYLVAYLSFGVSSIIAGLLIALAGLLGTVLGYGVAIAALGLFAQYCVNKRR
ncbi:hypothetical protein [Nonomuraea sp. NPDC049141]|uniref:hypothetical protein n=1 Tax=Nonomuraea sp. NPDC049141 TaxID=3155500 RepID=UPI0033D131FD